MALNNPRTWLIAYDIADPHRLRRLHRFLKRKATPVQYSVFLYEGSAMQIGRVVQDIEDYIDPAADDVRTYQIPSAVDCDALGRGSLPDGVVLVSQRQEHLPRLLQADKACYDEHDERDRSISVAMED